MGNSTDYTVETSMGKKSEREMICVFVWPIHFAVQ